MSNDQLASAALRLPPAERARLAESLWESLADPFEGQPDDEAASISLALRREQELADGKVASVAHIDLMKRLRA